MSNGEEGVSLKRPRVPSARRLLLLAATAVGLGAALAFAPDLGTDVMFNGARAQNLTAQVAPVSKPVGFADIVEKVKPAVISVRVKHNGPETAELERQSPLRPGSPMERFFREFGMPD